VIVLWGGEQYNLIVNHIIIIRYKGGNTLKAAIIPENKPLCLNVRDNKTIYKGVVVRYEKNCSYNTVYGSFGGI